MKKIFQQLLILIAVLLFLNACKRQNAAIVSTLNTAGAEALGPYFTQDNKGNTVLCWTEKGNDDLLYRLKYAVYNANSGSFYPAITVSGSEGTGTSPESMGKIAFKSDGTVMAVFGKRFESEKNPFAGAIYYNYSKDQGKNWSKPQFLHTDTAHTYGRGFFDIATLKNGELGAVWLDGRYGKTIKGLALFFTCTKKGTGFGIDTCLAKSTCECCRTDLFTDTAGNIHLAYRSIMFPPAMLGKQVRDMVYSFSKDNGKTFSVAKPISKDNWEIEGCPHSGPALAITRNGINAVWFTAGGTPGIYYTSSAGMGSEFKDRVLLTASGRHPQMIALSDHNTLAMVCEETVEVPHEEASMHMDHSKGGMAMQHAPATGAKIVLRVLKNGHSGNEMLITDGHHADHHAVITRVSSGLLIAWVREDAGHSAICYTFLKNESLKNLM